MKKTWDKTLIQDCITVGDKIAVAVSGGMDSMVLLHVMMQESPKADFDFFVINIEHGIRGKASKADTEFVKNYCDKFNIDFVGVSIDVPTFAKENKMTIEEAARLLRYREFQKLLDSGKCNTIALAHHKSDQAETILMRIIRGTGMKGLMGMKKVSGNYIRPLLDLSKNEIKTIQSQNNIPYVNDETNFNNDYTRNLLRNQVMPLLNKLSLNAEEGFCRLSRIATETENFISNYDNPINIDKNGVRLNFIENENVLLLKRRIVKCFNALGIVKDIEERHLNIIVDFIDAKNGSRLDMPYGVTIYREYYCLYFTNENFCKTEFTIPFDTGKIGFKTKILNISHYKGEPLKPEELIFDITKIPKNAVFRTRRDGDYIQKFGGGGSKKLGDFFTDKKVPGRIRDEMVLCADGSEILFIAGFEISDKVKVNLDDIYNTKNIYKIITLED